MSDFFPRRGEQKRGKVTQAGADNQSAVTRPHTEPMPKTMDLIYLDLVSEV